MFLTEAYDLLKSKDVYNRIPLLTVVKLKELSTQRLREILKVCNKVHSSISSSNNCYCGDPLCDYLCTERQATTEEKQEPIKLYMTILKEILSTREHIPKAGEKIKIKKKPKKSRKGRIR